MLSRDVHGGYEFGRMPLGRHVVPYAARWPAPLLIGRLGAAAEAAVHTPFAAGLSMEAGRVRS